MILLNFWLILRKTCKHFREKQFIELSKNVSKKILDLITKILAYPYEYMDCFDQFNETSLPPIDKFYSLLTGKNVTEDEYKNAQEIWKAFNIQNLEFTKLCNKMDVFLLTDIMENIRDISLKTYKLDPAYYYTTSGFPWDSMLKMTEVKLDILMDYDIMVMVLIVKRGLRGGITHCSKRNSLANNKCMGKQ